MTRRPDLSKPGRPFALPYAGPALRWFEQPEAMGLRLVGWADAAHPAGGSGGYRLESGEVVRGAVYRLPTRHGERRFIAGVPCPTTSAPDGSGPVAIDWSGGALKRAAAEGEAVDALRIAAVRADQLALAYAENEETRRAAYAAGIMAANLASEIAAAVNLYRKARREQRAGLVSAWHEAVVEQSPDDYADACRHFINAFDEYRESDPRRAYFDSFLDGVGMDEPTLARRLRVAARAMEEAYE